VPGSYAAAPASHATQPVYPPTSSTSYAPQQTDRMPVAAPARPADGYTDRMAVAPPAPAEEAVIERRSPGANVARWLLVILWLLGFGAVATLAALTFAFPANFQQSINPGLAPYGLQLDPNSIEATRLTTAGVLSGIAIFDLLMVFGLLARGRWAWVINLLVALAVTWGTIALAVLAFTTIPAVAQFNPQDPTTIALLGLIGFTLVYLILSFASRRAFFPRRVRA
jgi:magnesium-transporting ATPase (P-type)